MPLHFSPHASSKECMPASLTTAALPPTLSPMPPVQQNTDESSLLETVSGEVDLQSFLPNLSLGSQECQRIFELRLRELVLMSFHRPHIIINPFLAA